MASNSEATLQEKIASYREILAKDPHSTIFVSLCDACRRLGMLDEALTVARQGTEGLPWFSPGHVVLGQVLLERGQTGEALGCFNEALTLDGENLAAFKGLATIYSQKGQVEIARQVLERAQKVHPENSSIRNLLNRLSPPSQPVVEPESVSPAPVAEPVDEPAPEAPIATATIAELFVKQGLLPQACQVYRDILQADPDNIEARQKLGDLEQRIVSGPVAEGGAKSKAAEPVAADEPLATLQRWLAAIRLRREHVR